MLPDQSLVMLAGKARWGTDQFLTFSMRSSDGGRTWGCLGPPIEVFRCSTEPYGQGLMQPFPREILALGFQGSDEPEANAADAIAFSADAGKTWSDRVVIAADDGIDFREPALIRTDQPPYETYQSLSADGGAHWDRLRWPDLKPTVPNSCGWGRRSSASTGIWSRTDRVSVIA